MTNKVAAQLLLNWFDKDENDRLWWRGRRIEDWPLGELNAYRDYLLGADFRFTWPDFPPGAYCPWPRLAPW